MRVRRLSVPVLALGLLAAAPSARAADPMFDPTRLHEMRIVMDPNDWTSLQRDFLSNQYYAANFSLDGQVLQQVGIRSRGKGSRSGVKPGLEIDTNKYVSNQEFNGVKKLVMDNVIQDNTFLKEPLVYPVFEAMGIPSPQIAYMRVTVNDQYWGVYWLIENIDKNFLAKRFGDKEGMLYKYEYVEDYRFTDKGSDPKGYFPIFKPETHEDNPDGSALVKFVQTANSAPEAGFAAAIAPYLDVDKFLTYIAVENAIAQQDGFLGLQGMNNFYVYQFTGTTKFQFIPWDQDTSFVSTEFPVLQNVDTNVLTKKLLADPAKKQVYLSAIKAATAQAVNSGFLNPKIDAYYALMRNSVLEDTKKPWTNEQFEQGVLGLKGIISGRPAAVAAQIP
jgi:spore coat protein CotH